MYNVAIETSPTQQYAAYPTHGDYGNASKLTLLRNAYFGAYFMALSTVVVFFGGIVLSYLAGMLLKLEQDNPILGLMIFGVYGLMFVVNFFVAFNCTRKIATAKDKSTGYAVGVALLGMVFSPCFFGLLGSAVIQTFAGNEMKNYGLRVGFFGLKKADVNQRIAELSQAH